MSEPTRQQVKEAFNKTIERWEKIVGDVKYYHKSECALCQVYEGTTTCHKFCPIREYGNHKICHNTPHDDFTRDRTPENALAELNFLHKVYIWWMEGEQWRDMKEQWVEANKEKKKEEWASLSTKDLSIIVRDCGKDYGCYLEIRDNDELHIIADDECYLDSKNRFHMIFQQFKHKKYEFKIEGGNFRILKKI